MLVVDLKALTINTIMFKELGFAFGLLFSFSGVRNLNGE